MNIFIHRRDLRLVDNTTLNFICKNKTINNISPIFIFTPEQIDPKINSYFSNNLVQFMCESLEELHNDYATKNSTLNFFYGDYIKVLESIHKKYNINSVSFNVDYSPYAIKRDNNIKAWCKDNNIKCFSKEDMLLVNIIDNKNYPNEKHYEIFTHFKNYQIKNYSIKKVSKQKLINCLNKDSLFTKYSIDKSKLDTFYTKNKNIMCNGGRKKGEQKLEHINKQDKYPTLRNNLDYETSRLSPYINLGLVSIREVFSRVEKLYGLNHSLISELWWRDFFYNILYRNPSVVGNAMNSKFRNIKWDNNKILFNKWKNGMTGFPIVDACMNELNKTGYLHNRGRMIVASFLTKHLFTDWKWGEKYFAQKLIDYNISANNGGWQWTASTGVDSHRTFYRVFNPWLQIAKFDKDCKYTKKWLPSLKDVPNEHIKKWDKYYRKYSKIDYPKPIVNHAERRDYALNRLKSVY